MKIRLVENISQTTYLFNEEMLENETTSFTFTCHVQLNKYFI